MREEPTGRLSRLLLMLVTFLGVNIAWVFFRSRSIGDAFSMLGAMAGLNRDAAPVLPTVNIASAMICTGGLLLAHYYMRNRTLEEVVARAPAPVLVTAMAGMAFIVSITQGTGDAFIYFQF